jgi:hypothetical protein
MSEASQPTQLMEEYKTCQARATELESNIWKTATAFGVGSLTLAIIFQGSISSFSIEPYVICVIGVFVIANFLLWWRLALRWSSVQQVMIRRMEHIERKSEIRINLYIAYLNGEMERQENKNTRVEFSEISESNSII